MADLSLSQYLQLKGAILNQGVRSCAPSQSKISLRSLLLGINRRILHLTDLHIGLNNSTIPAIQVQNIINAIIRTYPKQDESYEYPRPIVVITWDIVDYYSPNHLDTAFSLLDQLTQDGFTVLVVPGNHDYSDSFSTDSFTPLEDIPVVGDMMKFVARAANEFIGKGQKPDLVSGMIFNPDAASNFKAKMTPYLHNGSYSETWKDKGAVYDLDFILLDGQDKEAHRPDWDDPKRFVREKVHDAVLAFNNYSWLYSQVVNIDRNTLADTIADAVANLTLDPVTIFSATLVTVQSVEDIFFKPFEAVAFTVAIASGDPLLITAATTGDVIFNLLDCGLAVAVASVAAAWVTVPPLDDKFFLHDGNFRLAHGFLDDHQSRFLLDRVNKDHLTQTLPIVCIHYWLNYPKMDTQYNTNNPGEDPNNTLVNETPSLFNLVFDICHLLLVGHIHENSYGRIHTFQASTKQNSLAYYSRAGSTFPDPVDWNDDYELKAHQIWLELTINLNTGKISTPYILDVDGNKYPLKYDMDRLQPGQRLNVNDKLV